MLSFLILTNRIQFHINGIRSHDNTGADLLSRYIPNTQNNNTLNEFKNWLPTQGIKPIQPPCNVNKLMKNYVKLHKDSTNKSPTFSKHLAKYANKFKTIMNIVK